MKWWTINL